MKKQLKVIPLVSFEMFFKSATAAALLAARATATIYYAGVAESGGEFGVYSRLMLFNSVFNFYIKFASC